MNDLITVATPTIGDTAWRLDIFFEELKRFTKMPYRHILCDDGTASDEAVENQKKVCHKHGVEHFDNPGPYGVSYNLNYLFEKCNTPWIFLVEDGLRPGAGWLESAMSFVEQVDQKSFEGHEVGMVGTSHIQDWTLAMAGGIPSEHSVMDFFRQTVRDDFYANWNDGYWCWNRMLPGLRKSCLGDTSSWTHEVACMKQLVLDGLERTGGLVVDPVTGQPFHPTDQEQFRLKFRTKDHFPVRLTAGMAWYPGAFMLVNMKAWSKVGRFRDGCTFFEGHLGLRMGINGFLSLALEFPPWIHSPSQGFSVTGRMGKSPRHHINTDDLFRDDFGGRTHLNAVDLANASIPLSKQAIINEQLQEIKITAVAGWEKYTEDPLI